MRRTAVIIVAVLLTGSLTVFESLNFTGFCYRQGRYLSREEFLDAAVRANLARHGPQNQRTKSYSSLADFYRLNPNCCAMHFWGHHFSAPIFVRLIGLYMAVAEIFYRTNDAAGVDNFYRSFVFINACGDVLRIGGEPQSTGPNT
jgi:hypothetical protein